MSDTVDKIEETGAKKVSVTGDINELTKTLENSKHVSDFKTNEKSCSVDFLYNGKIQLLLENLSRMNIKDLNITEPSLEEIFMNYYE